MTVIAQKPAAGVFGYEVADEIAQNKNLLQQSVAALEANGVVVPLPGTFMSPGLGNSDNRAGDPISMEKELLSNALAALAAITAKASITIASIVPADILTLTALIAGNAGNDITLTVASGTSSGKKITIAAPGYTTEVYDNVAATGNAFVAAIQGVSLIVSAALVGATGGLVPVSSSVAPLAGGLGAVVTAPAFPGVALDDGSIQRVQAWGDALFAALQKNGYIA